MYPSSLAGKAWMIHICICSVPCPEVQLAEKYRPETLLIQIGTVICYNINSTCDFQALLNMTHTRKYVLYHDPHKHRSFV